MKLIFLIVSRAVSPLGLSRREAWWKDAEILMLRHQLAVAGRERPGARARLTWPDRALLALLAGTLPIDRLAAMRLIVTPGTILRSRNLLMDLEDAGTRLKFVLHDRDARLTAAFNEVFRAAGARIIRAAVQAPRMNSIMERWVGSCRRELLDRTLVWNQRHLMIVLREYKDFYNTHRPHRALKQAAPLRQLPDGITDLDQFRIQRRDRAGGRNSRISPGRVGFRHPQVGRARRAAPP